MSDTDTDMQGLLREAAEEIRQLRRRNEVLEAKVSTMELFATVLHTKPFIPPACEMTEDVAWKLDITADIIAKELKREAAERPSRRAR